MEKTANTRPKNRVWNKSQILVRDVDGERLFSGDARDLRETEFGVVVVTRRELGLKDPQDWRADDAENPENWYEQEASTVFYPWWRVAAIETTHAFEDVVFD